MDKLQNFLLNKIAGMNEEELRKELTHIIESISNHELADIYSHLNYDEI